MSTLACSRAPKAEATYVSPAQCAACHPLIALQYARTGMAKSFTTPAARVGAAYYHAPSQSYFEMLDREGKYLQRRYQKTRAGKVTNVLEREIHYVMGSGAHVRTFVHRDGQGRLMELPLAWYSEGGGTWAMNPGYDRPDHMGFRRPLSGECLFCHSATPGPAPSAIDCQRCHGPGSEHVKAAQSKGKPEAIRKAIVNPARLDLARSMEVCMQCHLETTSFPLPNAIARFEQPPFSYRPGKPLGDFILYFDHSAGAGRDDKFELVSAVYRLRKSACFLRSGKMQCTTCHNPHDVPRGEAAVRHYAAACKQCHADSHRSSEDCAGCHMPKRRTEDVVHAVVTDHLIQRIRPRDAVKLTERHEDAATAYRGEVVPYYPTPWPPDAQLYAALAQVIQNSNLKAGIPRLAAAIEKHRPARADYYFHLADAWRDDGHPERALPLYEEALKREPKSVDALQKLAHALLDTQPARSEDLLRQATGNANAWYVRGLARQRQNKLTDAVEAFEKAAALDPDLPAAFNGLGGVLAQIGSITKAEESLREAIRLQPDFADAHNNLGALLAASGNLPEAMEHYETALRFRPGFTEARYNFGLALARSKQFADAKSQMDIVVRENPLHAGAHQVLGALLAGMSRNNDAVRHYKEALRIQPDFGRAMVGLAAVYASAGNRDAAIELLRKAATGSDASIRAQSEAMLRTLIH